ncbi:MAG TPA: RusA family crossover junction endodeoxyribonuclease [Persephonella sp.]|nr:RusA family crossover junction endodeoxyribonuclease [Hydrogenothermaceae bacterium]HIQ24873.1 RusA family crossover junction endodeoxyribonuclease [Persephonella sp.]
MKYRYYLSFIPPSKVNKVKINSRVFSKTGKRYIVPKEISIKINKAIWELGLQFEKNKKTFKNPIKVNITFILPNRRRRDLDNIMKTLGDCLVYANIINDDSLIFIQNLEKWIIKGEEGVIIEIEELKDIKIDKGKLYQLKKYKDNLNEF